MRKIPSNLENPIDNLLIYICEKLSPIYKYLKFTPNLLTTISLSLSIISVIFIYYNYFELGAIFFFISYFYDCFDGYFARKYNMITDFGDKYDHFSDILKYILIILVLLYKFNYEFNKKYRNKQFIIIIILIIFFILSSIHLGCQEVYYNNNNHEFLHMFKKLCFDNSNILLKYTRYFGTGTFILITTIIIIYIKNYTK
jgi:phosphatidylglycerophosphate synthase